MNKEPEIQAAVDTSSEYKDSEGPPTQTFHTSKHSSSDLSEHPLGDHFKVYIFPLLLLLLSEHKWMIDELTMQVEGHAVAKLTTIIFIAYVYSFITFGFELFYLAFLLFKKVLPSYFNTRWQMFQRIQARHLRILSKVKIFAALCFVKVAVPTWKYVMWHYACVPYRSVTGCKDTVVGRWASNWKDKTKLEIFSSVAFNFDSYKKCFRLLHPLETVIANYHFPMSLGFFSIPWVKVIISQYIFTGEGAVTVTVCGRNEFTTVACQKYMEYLPLIIYGVFVIAMGNCVVPIINSMLERMNQNSKCVSNGVSTFKTNIKSSVELDSKPDEDSYSEDEVTDELVKDYEEETSDDNEINSNSSK